MKTREKIKKLQTKLNQKIDKKNKDLMDEEIIKLSEKIDKLIICSYKKTHD